VTVSTQEAAPDVRWDLRSVDAGDPAEGWREVLERTYIPFDVHPSPAPGEHFDCRASRHRLGSVTLVENTHGRGIGRRGPSEIAATEDDLLGILVMCSGRIGLDFGDHSVVLSPGQVIMWDGARRGTFRTLGPVTKRTLIVPRERLRLVVPGYEAMVGRPLAADDPAAKLMACYLASLVPLVSTLDPLAREAVADAAVELARAVLAGRESPVERGLPTAALLTTIRHHIDEHLGDPSLSPASIARANAISVRTLHRVFEAAGESVSAVIRERRLGRCHADLLRGTDESVTVIALRWGFRDMSHFSRVFRRRFGASAREVQATARAMRPVAGNAARIVNS
jgi:AraC-like DNA-binding protein